MEKFNFALFAGHLAIYLFVWVFAITAHGAVTAWMSNRFGDDTARNEDRISFNPFVQVDLIGTIILPVIGFVFGWLNPGGGIPMIAWGKRVPIDSEKWRNPKLAAVSVALASTFASISIALIAFILLKLLFVSGAADVESFTRLLMQRNFSDEVSWLAPIELILWYGLILNIALAVYSLIPFPPFSGGAALSALLPTSFKPLFNFFERYGLIFGLLLIYSGVIGFVLRPVFYFVIYLLGLS